MSAHQQYIDIYDEHRSLIDAGSASPLNALRPAAREELAKGLPTRRVEQYRYTDIAGLLAPDYGLNLRRLQFPVNGAEAFRCSVPGLGTRLYYIVGDRVSAAPQTEAVPVDGLYVGSLADYARQHPEWVAARYGRLADAKDSLTALNTLLAQDGLLIKADRGLRCEQTLQIISLGRADTDLMTHRRLLVDLDEGSDISLLFCEHTIDRHRFLTTQVGEIWMAAASRLAFYSIEETGAGNVMLDNLHFRLGSRANLECGHFTLQNGTTRRYIDVNMTGEGASSTVVGGVIADHRQHTDTNLLMHHSAGHCTSDILYKYVLDGESVGAFSGKVLVDHGAQKTESQETNANLCVSPRARMYTQPILEIYADDVKCNHGSTVGRLDERTRFYMNQRGIPEAEANLLLQQAFLGETLRKIPLAPLQDKLQQMIEQRFRFKLGGCRDCNICHPDKKA